ncbi:MULTISPECIES: hypothetical protein [unclassified Oceanobacillus]|uniref:hypothetical protein n=1 Tax=unclassified Oceanobacillus TaxID=2630292 RepID=UPI001BEA6C6C|nr:MULTISPECIES: hypothetical protein [unclassified Oceanobacillus]MBT2601266.1 hypothetical protein [Oceanobacillus sp. ISL-74]MBT2653628.1 hypothetical protein [Oceanobacillus sp. ISL-73]
MEVTVKVRMLEESEFLMDISKPKRVKADYLGRHKNIMLCVREEEGNYIVFEPSSGKAFTKNIDKETAIRDARELVDKHLKVINKQLKVLAPLYGITCFAREGREILGNTLIDPKVCRLAMKRTNGRYKEITDKVFRR